MMAMRIRSSKQTPPTAPPTGPAIPEPTVVETVGKVDGVVAEVDVVAAREYMAYTLNVPVRYFFQCES